jgi:hypothetical protein
MRYPGEFPEKEKAMYTFFKRLEHSSSSLASDAHALDPCLAGMTAKTLILSIHAS